MPSMGCFLFNPSSSANAEDPALSCVILRECGGSRIIREFPWILRLAENDKK
jgi:hypothetical protein